MNSTQRILHFFILPILAILLFPPGWLLSGLAGVLAAVILFVLLGILLLQGRSAALTLSIFLQGLSVIVRLMMLFPHFTKPGGSFDMIYGITTALSIGLSTYLLLRLDRSDIRAKMVR
jgi:hypothetical protein